MRIVQVANFYGPRSGGIRTMMHHLADGYRMAGHESVIVVPGARDDDLETEHGRIVTLAGPVVPRAGGYRVITDVDRVCVTLDRLGPDRLEVSDRTTLRALGWWASAAGVPAVMWAHERIDGVLSAHLPGRWPSRWMADSWNRATAPRFDRVVCSTAFAQAEFDRIGWRRVSRVPLGVDLDHFHPDRHDVARRAELLAPGEDTLVVLCSRLSPEKRPEVAVDMLAQLRASGLRARLVVMGTGPSERRLARAGASLPVTMLGHVADRGLVATTLASADVVVAPGPIETFGLAALEALACGTPVVADRSGALGEIITAAAGRVAAGTAEAFARAVVDLLASTPGLRRAGARARAEHFPWERTVQGMLSVHGLAGDGLIEGHLRASL